MAHVLTVLADLSSRPLENCLPTEARRQPLFDAAVRQILARAGRGDLDDGVAIQDFNIDGPAGPIAVRLYRSELAPKTSYAPMLLYIHGGGWVLGDLDSYDASPRALARRTGAIVLSTHYRQAPEHRFPAAHEDTFAAWTWLVDHARELGGDPRRIAVAGEGVGANMAMNVTLSARAAGMQRPTHQVLITPLAGNDLTRASYVENMRGRPLSTPMVQWFSRHAFADRADMTDLRINLVEREDFWGMPAVTLILAELDPLRSEGELLGTALARQNVVVDTITYSGVGHDFFGMGALVNKAMFAQAHVAGNLGRVFGGRPILPSAG